MKKLFAISTLLLFCVLLFSGVAYGWSTTGGDGTRYGMVRETGVFFNNSGGTLTCGMIVIIDTQSTESGSGATLQQAVAAGSTMGSYVTTIATADMSGVVGVVLHGTTGTESCPNQTACVVVTKGPAQILVKDSSDGVNVGERVGTTTTAGWGGYCANSNPSIGGGVGIALEGGTGSDNFAIWTWVDPY